MPSHWSHPRLPSLGGMRQSLSKQKRLLYDHVAKYRSWPSPDKNQKAPRERAFYGGKARR